MSDLGSNLPVPVRATIETRAMKLKWLQSAKQEQISKIVHTKQAIEDLTKGRIPELERQILEAEQKLANYEESERQVKASLDASTV